MIDVRHFEKREEWLQARKGTVGGSDAGCFMGLNKWKSNVDLWEILTGRQEPADLSDNPLVQYGISAEPLIRNLFALDHPELKVDYYENNMFINSEYPFGHYSADGELYDEDGRFGLLEIKTATISSALQNAQWKGQIPPSYFCQLLFGMMITGAKFCYLRAALKYGFEDDKYSVIRDYYIERNEVEEDMKVLAKEFMKFEAAVKNDECPGLKLPEI